MWCEIKQNGDFHIYPTNEVESYALKRWAEDNIRNIESKNVVVIEEFREEKK